MFGKKVFSASLGNILAQAVTLGSLPFLGRIYAPAEYAVWALVFATGSIGGIIATLRYELAIVKERDEARAAALFHVCLYSTLLVSIVIFGLMSVQQVGSVLYGDGHDRTMSLALFTAIITFLAGFRAAAQHVLVRHERYLALSASTFVMALTTAVVQVTFGWLTDAGVLGLLVGGSLGLLLALAMNLGDSNVRQSLAARVSSKHLASVMRAYRLFPIYSIPYSLSAVLKDRVSLFVIGGFAGLETVGYFQLAYRTLYAPVTLLSAGLRPVIYRQYCASGSGTVGRDLAKVFVFLVPVAVALVVLGGFYAEAAFTFVFGEQWAPAGRLGSILCWPMATLLLVNWMDRLFDGTNRQGLALGLELGSSIFAITALAIPYWIGPGYLDPFRLYAGCLVIYHIVYLIIIRRVLGVPVPLGRIMLHAVGWSATLVLVVLVLEWQLTWLHGCGVVLLIFLIFTIHKMWNSSSKHTP